MYVCLCNGYRDAEIREIAESGVRCAKEVYLTLGNGPCCGTCLDCAQGIVDSVHGGAEAREPAEPAAADALLMAAE
jgi:bacterioferritin-associated ferredoxin